MVQTIDELKIEKLKDFAKTSLLSNLEKKKEQKKIENIEKLKIEQAAIEKAQAEVSLVAKMVDNNKPILRDNENKNFIKGTGKYKTLTDIEQVVKMQKELIAVGIKPPPLKELMLRRKTREKMFAYDMYRAMKIIIKDKKLTDENIKNPMVALFVKGIEEALKGDYSFYKDIMDRYYGRPHNSLEVSGNLDSKIDISDEQYKQLIILINQRTERVVGEKGGTE